MKVNFANIRTIQNQISEAELLTNYTPSVFFYFFTNRSDEIALGQVKHYTIVLSIHIMNIHHNKTTSIINLTQLACIFHLMNFPTILSFTTLRHNASALRYEIFK